MISYENIKEAQDTLIKCWGTDGKKVIEECAKVKPFNGSMKSFFEYCTCCGGNWVGMLLSGVKALFPSVYDAIPNDMSITAFCCVCATMVLCGVDIQDEC